jgi:hypothetical protein
VSKWSFFPLRIQKAQESNLCPETGYFETLCFLPESLQTNSGIVPPSLCSILNLDTSCSPDAVTYLPDYTDSHLRRPHSLHTVVRISYLKTGSYSTQLQTKCHFNGFRKMCLSSLDDEGNSLSRMPATTYIFIMRVNRSPYNYIHIIYIAGR